MRSTHILLMGVAICFCTSLSIFAQPPLPSTPPLPDAEHAYQQGTAQYDSSEWAAAAGWFRQAVLANAQMPEGWYNLALAYYQMGDYLEAERHLEKTLALNPFHENAHGLLGMTLYQRGCYARAIKSFNFAINQQSTTELRLARAICFIADDRPKLALPDLDEILYDNPGHYRSCLAKSAALMSLGQHNYAMRFLNRILDNNPENVNALTNRAICHFYLGDPKQSGADFDKAFSVRPTLTTLLARAKCLLATGAFQKAMENVRMAMQLDAKAPAVYYVMGEVEMGLSEYENALKSFDIALDLDHTCMDCLLLKSEAETHIAHFEEAVKDIYSVLETEPNHQQARDLLLWVYAQMDRDKVSQRETLSK